MDSLDVITTKLAMFPQNEARSKIIQLDGTAGQGPSHEADLGMSKEKVSASKVGTESDLSEEKKRDKIIRNQRREEEAFGCQF